MTTIQKQFAAILARLAQREAKRQREREKEMSADEAAPR